jgi:soluble lytic murein transglycosylase-like protein
MQSKWVGRAFYLAVAIAALALNSTFAQEGDLDFMQQDDWVTTYTTSAPSYAAPSGGDYAQAAHEACQANGCDGDYLYSILLCESGGDHGAIGPNGERGVMQYHPNGAWPEMAWASPIDQIWHAAWAISNGYASHWVCA